VLAARNDLLALATVAAYGPIAHNGASESAHIRTEWKRWFPRKSCWCTRIGQLPNSLMRWFHIWITMLFTHRPSGTASLLRY